MHQLWGDDAAVAALGPALARRPALRELRVWDLDCVHAPVPQTAVLGDYLPDRHALEPAAAALLGFVAGRMPALEVLSLAPGLRGVLDFAAVPPAWLRCLRYQLRSLRLNPVLNFPPDLGEYRQLARLEMHFRSATMLRLPPRRQRPAPAARAAPGELRRHRGGRLEGRQRAGRAAHHLHP